MSGIHAHTKRERLGGSLRSAPRTVILCPKCGGAVHSRASGELPRHACADPRCPFAHGYHVEVFPREKGTPPEADRLMAVPYDVEGKLMPDRAVPYPRAIPKGELDATPGGVQQ